VLQKVSVSVKIVVLLLIALVLGGTLGYMLIEGWSFDESLYMTIITLTTTGFQEVHPLSLTGRRFTILIMVLGIGTVAYSFSVIMNEVLSMDFADRRRKKMDQKFNGLSKHTIICGYGRMGQIVCKELAKAKMCFVVIEKAANRINELKKTEYLWIEGDASQDEHLKKAGIEKARVLVSMLDDDADNLYLCLAGRSLNAGVMIIARANEPSAEPKLKRAGADKVVMPVVASGHRVAKTVINPAVDSLLQITGMDIGDKREIGVSELRVNPDSRLIGRTLADSGFKLSGVMVIGVREKGVGFKFAPPKDYRFAEGDCLITLSTEASLAKMQQEFNLGYQR